MKQGLVAIGLVTLSLVGCKKGSDMEPTFFPVVPPETYAFENVSFSGQTERQDQLDEMIDYVSTANAEGVTLDAEVLRAMFENTGDNGGGNFSFSSTKQLKNKCFEPDQSVVDAYFASVASISASTETGSNGTAGRIASADGSSMRLFDSNGWEYKELIEKTLMGAVFYYQALNTYLSDEGMDVDNEEVTEGTGTEMEHHFDEAYGYFGATTDFPTNTEDVRYWAKYAVRQDAVLGSATDISLAFRTGRQAIVKERYDVRDEAIADAIAHWELLCAAQAIHYLNSAIDNISSDYDRNHVLSEAYAFASSLFYNTDKRITDSELTQVKDYIGTNFYEVTTDNLTAARDLLAQIYGLEDLKTTI